MPAYDATLFNPPAPLATVTICKRNDRVFVPNVPMLLDSGADVTLIPQTAVTQLGLDADPSETYELMGFDGNTICVGREESGNVPGCL